MIFFDIDGTLLNDEKKALPSTREALQKLKENGHEAVIATGRNLFLANPVIEDLDFKHYVVCNGALGYFHGQLVYEKTLDKADFERLLKVTDQQKHQVVYESADTLRRRRKEADGLVFDAMKSIGHSVPKYDEDFYLHNPLYQALLFYFDEEKDAYENGQFSKFRFVRWHDASVDLLPHDGSKAHTAMELANRQGFALEDTIAFGDGENDIELLSETGTGIAMGNALEKLKLKADKITASCNDDGIYLALKDLNLI